MPADAAQLIHTLVLTDLVGSTELTERLGDDAAAALRIEHDRVARDLLRGHGGREIDKADGFLLLFDGVKEAVGFALAYHRTLAALDPELFARVGVHTGEVILTRTPQEDVALGAKPIEVDGLAKAVAARVMSVALGGQTLITAEAKEGLPAVPQQVRSHGHWRLKGLSEPIELFEIGDAGAPFTPPPDIPKVYRVVRIPEISGPGQWLPAREVPHSLPAERDDFFGRRRDLAALADALERGARLISILGIGGTGKTRLVTRYGWNWLGDWPGGVWFCDLSDARGADGVHFAMARTLDVPLGANPVLQLGHAIAGRGRCLVILDNFEQVVGTARATLGAWLDGAREARFLVTTREVLGLSGEVNLALPPLGNAEAVQLFASRARSVRQDFAMSADNRDDVSTLVDLLDRLPLAIELAAARVRMLAPKALLARMDQRFKLLTGGSGRRDRQATLRAALDWSWDLLVPWEQAAIAQLSVFEGGFGLEAAEAVLDLGAFPEAPWALDAIRSLVDKSLVRVRNEARFDLLVSVQAYAQGRLDELGMRDSAEERHGRWFASGEGPEDGPTERRPDPTELDNRVAAARRAVARADGRLAAAAALLADRVWEDIGPRSASVELLREVLAVEGLDPLSAFQVRRALGSALWRTGHTEEARAVLEPLLEQATASGDRRLEGLIAMKLGGLYREIRVGEARAMLERALEAHREVGNRRSECTTYDHLGIHLREIGQDEASRAAHERALAMARELDLPRTEAHALNHLGVIFGSASQAEESRVHFLAAIAVALDSGDRSIEATARGNLGLLESGLGNHREARVHIERSVRLKRAMGDRRSEGISLGNLGNMLRVVGDPDEARPYLTQALAIHREIGFSYGQPYWLLGLALLDAQAGALDAALEQALEAVATAERFPAVAADALSALARVRLARGESGLALEAIDRSLALEQGGGVGVLVAATEGLVAAAFGDRGRSESALERATADPDACREGTEIALVVAAARRLLREGPVG